MVPTGREIFRILWLLVEKAKEVIGYQPTHTIKGLKEAVDWYWEKEIKWALGLGALFL